MTPRSVGDPVSDDAAAPRRESIPVPRHVQAEMAIRLESQLAWDRRSVRRRVRYADPIAGVTSIEHRCEGQRGTDPCPPILRHDGRRHPTTPDPKKNQTPEHRRTHTPTRLIMELIN